MLAIASIWRVLSDCDSEMAIQYTAWRVFHATIRSRRPSYYSRS